MPHSNKLEMKIDSLLNKQGIDSDMQIERTMEWCNNFRITEPDEQTIEDCESNYLGYFATHYDFGTEMAERFGILIGLPDMLHCYFDYSKYGRDLILGGDAWESKGHYFSNH